MFKSMASVNISIMRMAHNKPNTTSKRFFTISGFNTTLFGIVSPEAYRKGCPASSYARSLA